jgi:hypothetical protein
VKGYLELLRLPGARAAAIPAAVARVAVSMVALALLVATVEAGYGYGAAGAASAAYAAGYAVAGPVLGRLMDRVHPAAVVRVAGVAAPAALGTVALGLGRFSVAVLVAVALVAGLGTPPVGASMRALWTRLTANETLLRRAYAFEATLSEAFFVVGPACLSGLAVALDARAALGVTAAVMCLGCVAYARVLPANRGTRAAAWPVRSSAALVTVLAGVACTAAMTGVLTVALAVQLPAQHSPVAFTGALLALQSVASISGGLAYGALTGSPGVFARYLLLLGALAVTLCLLPVPLLAHRAGLSAGGALVLLGLLLLPSGAAIAPTGAAEFQLVGDLTPPARMTETFAVVGAVIAVGEAGGVALAGLLADVSGTMATLLLPAACAVAGLAVALSGRRPVLAALSGRALAPATPAEVEEDGRVR